MLTRSLIAFAGFVFLSAAYKLDISDSELKSALDDPKSTDKIFKCLLGGDNEICDVVGKVLKDILQDVINTDCVNCSKEQNKIIGQFFVKLSVKNPEKINMTLDVYDPKRESLKKFASTWRERGINI